MAENVTINKPAPILTGSLTAFLNEIDKLGKGAVPASYAGLDTSQYAPQVADRTALQTGARDAASATGITSLLGSGLDASGGVGAPTQGSIADFMSPYQQEVMDTTLTEYDRQQTIGQQGLRDQAIQAGAYGGGREGIMQSEYMNRGAMGRGQLQAQLLNQGFQQAQAARAADLQARQGLGTYQSALGQEQQQYDQALKDATQIANREQQFQPFTQMGLIGQQLAQIQPGAFATQTVGPAAAGPVSSPMSQFLGGAAGAAGIMGKLGIFG
jgi:hypothetical protein